MTPFEIGTDLSSSIRIPAHFCGVFGLKPTEHRVSLAGLIPGLPPPRSVRLMACIGPMARTVEDLALLYSILARPDGHDTDVQPVPVDAVPELQLKQLRGAVAPTFPGFPVAADIRAAVAELAQYLNRFGVVVEEAALPEVDFKQDLSRAGALIGMGIGACQPQENKPPTPRAHYWAALHRRDQSMLAWEHFCAEGEVLLCSPSMPTAFPHCATGSPLPVDGQKVEYGMVSAHATVFNYPGPPAGVFPSQLAREGLPIGVQMVGKRWEESRLLAMAKALSAVTGEFPRPPAY